MANSEIEAAGHLHLHVHVLYVYVHMHVVYANCYSSAVTVLDQFS